MKEIRGLGRGGETFNVQRSTSNVQGLGDEAVLRAVKVSRWLGEGAGRTPVLREVSLDLYGGSSCAVVGPSGCGKSSLLYALGLLDRPDAGEVWLGGREWSGASDDLRAQARRERIGFVFQFHFLMSEFSALENVMLPMQRCRRIPVGERRERAELLLERVGLVEKKNRLATQLAGGEQQRVAIARALANSAEIILADEPTGTLDEANAERVVELLLDLGRDERRSVVIVTHNAEIAERCHRVLRMKDGVFV